MFEYEREFPSSDMETRAALLDIVSWLGQHDTAAADRETVELILAEALNNVVEHAYARAPGPIRVSVWLDAVKLNCAIIDHGLPIPSDELPSPPLPVIAPPDDLPEGGFGWHIIRSLTTGLRYKRCGDRNELGFSIPLVGA